MCAQHWHRQVSGPTVIVEIERASIIEPLQQPYRIGRGFAAIDPQLAGSIMEKIGDL